MDYISNNEYTEVYRRLPFMLQLAYGVGHVLNDICAAMWFTYLLVYFNYVLEFSASQSGFVLFVGQVADALATPFVGFHSDQSDNLWLCKYGRRKTWHLLGTLCILITFPFIFSPCVNCENSHKYAQLFYYSLFVIIFQFGWAAVQISHLSLIPEMSPNENDRTKLTAIRYFFTVISNLLVYVITLIVLHLNNGDSNAQIGPNDSSKFRAVVFIGLLIGIGTTIIFHIFVKEENDDRGHNVRGVNVKLPVLEVLRNPQTYQVGIIYMSTRLFVNLTQVYIPLYLHKTLNMPASGLAIIPLIVYVGGFITCLVIENLNRRMGRKISYIIGTAIGLIACIWIQFQYSPNFKTCQIYIIALFFGIAGSIILVTSLSITADLIGDKTGSGAFVYGIMSFGDKLTNGIAVVLIQDLYSDQLTIYYYRNILTYVGGGTIILGAITVLFIISRPIASRSGYERISDSNSINSNVTSVNDNTQEPLLS